MKSQVEDPTCRDNSNDALFGSILVIEAALRAVIEHLGTHIAPDESFRLVEKIRESLRSDKFVTRFGTGHDAILEGVRMSLSSIAPELRFGQQDISGSTSSPTDLSSVP